MLIDDIIYVSILLACIGLGPIFRSVKNPNARRWISTAAGVLVATVVSGWHVAHPLLITIVNATIISFAPQRKRHIASFLFSFFYLLVVFRLTNWYGVPSPPTHTNLILMIMTLRYGGLGYELNSIVEESQNDSNNHYYDAMREIGFLDVIHYGFSYMGVLTGPYYRYRTYWDCLNRNLGDYIDCWTITLYKLQLIAVTSVLYLLIDYYYPYSYIWTDEFLQRSFLYRACYVYPAAASFRVRIYAGILFSECVCLMAGLGIYPASTETRPGLGPKNYKAFVQIFADREKLEEEPMDYETVHNINIWEIETCYSVRRAIKNWNTTIQFWMANYVYKTFPYKAMRAPAVFLLSATWHGYAIGYYVAIVSVAFFLPVEDIYVEYYNTSTEGSYVKKSWWILLSWMKLTCMTYLQFAMLLLNRENIFAYYNSVYWIGHVFAAFLYIIGIALKPYLTSEVKSKKPLSMSNESLKLVYLFVINTPSNTLP